MSDPMRFRQGILFGLLVLAGLLLALLVLIGGPSQGFASTGAPPTPLAPAEPDLVFLILPMPSPDAIQGIAGEASEEAVMIRLAAAAAQPLADTLMQLQREGKIEGFHLRPELFAIEVRRPAPGALEGLPLPPGAAIARGPDALSCVRQGAEAVRAQWQALRARPALEGLQAASLETQATNPSIHVYAPPGASFTFVTGATDPNTSVRLRIYRGGAQIYEQWTTSGSDGSYRFYPPYTGTSCEGGSGYAWTLRAGDVVEVTAGSRSAQTVVAFLQAWANPRTDTVAGRTEPGRIIEVVLSLQGTDLCSSTPVTQTSAVDGAGNFSISFPNFDGQAWGYVYARDGNGNSTFISTSAFHLRARLRGYRVYGYLPPDTGFTATLSRGSTVVTQTTRWTDSTGFFWWYLWPERFQPGDVISVTGGGVTLRLTAADLSLSIDPVANQVSGTTAPNHRVRILFYRTSYYPLFTTCGGGRDCRGTTSDSAGRFSVTSSLDWTRGDGVDVNILDTEGNSQYDWRYASIIILEFEPSSTWTEIRGYWGDPSASTLTITLRAPDNTVKASSTATPFESGSFSVSFWSIAPGDRVEVTDGRTTERTTVPVLTARLDSGTRQLRGRANPGRVVAYLRDYRREGLYWGSPWPSYTPYCVEGTASGGSYALSFPSGAQIGGMDGVNFWAFDSDGHAATFRQWYYSTPFPGLYLSPVNAFTVWARQDGQQLWGVVGTISPATSIPVTITVKRGATVLTSTVQNAAPTFNVNLGVVMQPGDVVQVRTGDGDAVDLNVPSLAVNRDTARNEIYGQAPASDYVQVFAVRWASSPYEYKAKTVQAGADGSYRTGFADLYWSDCSPVQMGHPCVRGRVDFINSQGHTISVWESAPPPLGPDAYEPDDVAAQARPYTGIQDHTFHTVTDTDWISFTVPAADVGISYIIRIFDTGLSVYGDIRLYQDPSQDSIGSWWFYRDEEIVWTPSAPGTYYLRIQTPNGRHCEARYRLMILPVRSRVYLPLIMRSASGR